MRRRLQRWREAPPATCWNSSDAVGRLWVGTFQSAARYDSRDSVAEIRRRAVDCAEGRSLAGGRRSLEAGSLTALPSAEQLKAFVERDRARLEAFRATTRKDKR